MKETKNRRESTQKVHTYMYVLVSTSSTANETLLPLSMSKWSDSQVEQCRQVLVYTKPCLTQHKHVWHSSEQFVLHMVVKDGPCRLQNIPGTNVHVATIVPQGCKHKDTPI